LAQCHDPVKLWRSSSHQNTVEAACLITNDLDRRGVETANAPMLIYKVLRPIEWSQMRTAGETLGAPVDLNDGYIHFSTAAQLQVTLSKHFGGERDLILLACDSDNLAADIRWEPSRGGDLFPHLYRPLRLSDVIWNRTITKTPEGHQTGPLE
jgi:uncharacterized protein (DUF952 family)